MFKTENSLENRNGTLYFDECNTVELAEKYGTPLYVMSETQLRSNYRRLRDAFVKHYKNFKLYYAVKANNNLSVLNILRQEGSGADCSAPAEIQLALRAGFNAADLLYTGNYNTLEELRFAAEQNVVINLDDATLVEKLAKVCNPAKLRGICFRFNPGIGDSGAEKLILAGPDSKFGITEDKIFNAYRRAKELGFRNFGIHMMTGSNVLKPEYFPKVAEKLFATAERISREVGIEFSFVNIGGGFGVPYRPNENELDIDKVAELVTGKFKEQIAERGHNTKLLIEPGRYIACTAGVLLTRVHHVKRAGKTFIGTDAGMNTLLRPAMYNAYHEILLANRLDEKQKEVVTVTGQVCENTDHICRDRAMPSMQEGDLLAVLNAGAYGFSMSSQYNSRPRCAEVLVTKGEHALIRQRETLEDLIGKQTIPTQLQSKQVQK
ncbi:MAG: diaminopimelate decarboxylase [Candidatus Micrarchaeota archaeon]